MPAQMKRLFRRLRERLAPVLLSDTAFVEKAYREVLGREADQDGLTYYRSRLREGESRTAVLLGLAASDEFARRFARPSPSLPSLRQQRPSRYRREVDRTTGQPVWVFASEGPSDLDWLETQILKNGYYEQPGVWNLGVDVDKRLMAEMIASFAPERALELGCAAGAVLECLRGAGIRAEGVEISSLAADQASPDVRPLIHRGDLLALDLPSDYDVVFGLDVFEHLNPNRLDAYLARLTGVTRPGGYLFCNVPAFGADPVFGTVFPTYLEGWERERSKDGVFSLLHVDDLGYPLHGHLIWAESAWWVRRFEAQGLRRETGIEEAFHAKYDPYMDKRSRARKAFYVFSKEAEAVRSLAVAERIRASASKVLE
jgi:2-polyprenyl-3-methyl-5-hydroxy-6-metoxy-1,4-benzoquinol methylase